MTTKTIDDGKVRRRGFALRFSLRMLMLIMTAFAIGSGVWWRWPIQRTQQPKLNHHIAGVNTLIYGTETITYHRGWNGGLIQHGRRTLIFDGELYEDEMFQEGIKHGPARYPHGMGYYDYGSATGEWHLGKQHGTWTFTPVGWQTSASGKRYRSLETWNRGQRHGVFEWFDESGKSCYRHEFRNDLLIDPENNPRGYLVLKRVADGELKDPEIVQSVCQSTSSMFSNNRFAEVLEDFHERHRLRMAFRGRHRVIDNQGTATAIWNVPVSTHDMNIPLYAALDNILRPLDYILDYRFGVLSIVDAEGAENWQDATGVMDLRPSPETSLASRLDAPPKPTCLEPLRDVLRNLAADQGLLVNFRPADPSLVLRSISQDEMVGLPREVITLRNSPIDNPKEPLPITLRQLLGLILDQANLHCHEEKGVLIIESAPKGPPASASTTSPRRP